MPHAQMLSQSALVTTAEKTLAKKALWVLCMGKGSKEKGQWSRIDEIPYNFVLLCCKIIF